MRALTILVWVLKASWCYTDFVFYYYPSVVELRPAGSVEKTNDFGFSIAYQDGAYRKLVVGAPHADRVGSVYTCPVDNLQSKTVDCGRVQFDDKKFKQNEKDPDQKLCLGASVVATPKYFMACAPLWTAVVTQKDNENDIVEGSYGTCFLFYKNKESQAERINGLLEQYTEKRNKLSKNIEFKSLYGGLGWNALSDPSDEWILIGKPGVRSDIHYLNRTDPMIFAQSIYFNGVKSQQPNDLKGHLNAGYALASGKFFSNLDHTVYAFNLQDLQFKGKVHFLYYDSQNRQMATLMYRNRVVGVFSAKAGSMFGQALGRADVTAEARTDLLIGAPGYSSDEKHYEAGAIHICLGGKLETYNSRGRLRKILGQKTGSRFGTSVASNDLDDDGLPEIFVSAPFEGTAGALYIISGQELDKTLIKTPNLKLSLSDLELTQHIVPKSFRWVGFSLQVLPDLDDNGCDELALGSPGSARVLVLRCVPAITANVFYRNLPGTLKHDAKNFTVEVCVNVSYKKKHKKITTKLTVLNAIQAQHKYTDSKTKILKDRFDVDLNKSGPTYCETITTIFGHEGIGAYYFVSNLTSNIDSLLQKTDFDPAWVRLSVDSKTKNFFRVNRACLDVKCVPKLELLPLLWNNQKITNSTTFHVSSSVNSANVTVAVRNVGPVVYDACMRVRVSGTRVLSTACTLDDSSEVGVYKCLLPHNLPSGITHTANIVLSMLSNDDDEVQIEALLYDYCYNSNISKKIEGKVSITYAGEEIQITGHSNSFTVTDTQLLNKKQLTIGDQHQYTITNYGNINWRNLVAAFTLPVKNYLTHHTMSASHRDSCVQEELSDMVQFRCNLSINANSSIKLIVTTEILKDKIARNLVNGKLVIESEIVLFLKPELKFIKESQNTTIFYVQEMTFKNNKNLNIILGVIGAIIVLGIMIFILYKVGFFKRKEKERLEEIKRQESIRRSVKSMKQSTSGNGAGDGQLEDDVEDLDMEVLDECFQPLESPENAPDNKVLIEPSKTSKSRHSSQAAG